MSKFNILTCSMWTFFIVCFMVSCSSSKKVNAPPGDPFPIVEVATVSWPISIYSCKWIVKDRDTVEVNTIFCSDSVRFEQLFSNIVVHESCLYAMIEGTTWYSVSIGPNGALEELKVIREVDNCFRSTTAQMESLLSEKFILEKVYFNTELLFFHKFGIMKIEN